eukprot:CAMPEP_0179134080 /NCGR_PEP_ID=MMETSP0796-20121207/63786_1 /TAXON_ID=73915 /ORGANISM="Pyrodinium bahamense, Strain pbaha01" /LENGTH=92 /DNA_ID=CAMNT_0020833061 /DNA_START=191 /DNA_END=469 /DNA_ORIENTATION=+
MAMVSGCVATFLLKVQTAILVPAALGIALASMAAHVVDAAILRAASPRGMLGSGRAGVAATLLEVTAAIAVRTALILRTAATRSKVALKLAT